MERNTHFTALPACLVAGVPRCKCPANSCAEWYCCCKEQHLLFLLSYPTGQTTQRNCIHATASTRVVHQVLLVYPLSLCVAASFTVVNSFSMNGQNMSFSSDIRAVQLMAPMGAGLLLCYRIAMVAGNMYLTQVLVGSCRQSSSLELKVPLD